MNKYSSNLQIVTGEAEIEWQRLKERGPFKDTIARYIFPTTTQPLLLKLQDAAMQQERSEEGKRNCED